MPLLLLAAAAACSPAKIAEGAVIVPHAAVSASTRPAPAIRTKAFTRLGLTPVEDDLWVEGGEDVRWPADCTVTLVRGGFAGAVTEGGLQLDWSGPGARIRAEPVRIAASAASEPPHPTVAGARFERSTSVYIGDWRVGAWRLRNGQTLLAAYRPGRAEPPRPVLRSQAPVIDLSYLGAPDAPGGHFWILQRLGPNRYRRATIGWDERLLRAVAP